MPRLRACAHSWRRRSRSRASRVECLHRRVRNDDLLRPQRRPGPGRPPAIPIPPRCSAPPRASFSLVGPALPVRLLGHLPQALGPRLQLGRPRPTSSARGSCRTVVSASRRARVSGSRSFGRLRTLPSVTLQSGHAVAPPGAGAPVVLSPGLRHAAEELGHHVEVGRHRLEGLRDGAARPSATAARSGGQSTLARAGQLHRGPCSSASSRTSTHCGADRLGASFVGDPLQRAVRAPAGPARAPRGAATHRPRPRRSHRGARARSRAGGG